MKMWLGSERPITILDLSGVPSSMMNDIIGIVLRVLYDGLFWARNLSEGGRERPLLIVMEAAHTYLNANLDGAASKDVKRYVKEGRKYGIGAMIGGQCTYRLNTTITSKERRHHVTGNKMSDHLNK